jgi:hypothetical protein
MNKKKTPTADHPDLAGLIPEERARIVRHRTMTRQELEHALVVAEIKFEALDELFGELLQQSKESRELHSTLVQAVERLIEIRESGAPALEELRKRLASESGRHAVEARHSQPGGSRDLKARVVREYQQGRYSSKNQCAEALSAKKWGSMRTLRRYLVGIR